MKYFKVLHDFVATDVVELSVRKGDLLCAQERVEQDGWLKVELASDTRRRGFVPATYVKEVAGASSSSASVTHLPSGYTNPSTTAASAPQPSSFTSAALSFGEKAVSAMPPSPMHAAYAGGAVHSRSVAPYEPSPAIGSTDNFLANPNAVVEAFMKNEVYFKQLMKQRQDSLAKLENGLAEALSEMSACKDKNAILARKLRDLDVTIEKERKKWKERVEEEKGLVQRTATNTTQYPTAGTVPPANAFTTTNSYVQRSVSHSARSSAAR